MKHFKRIWKIYSGLLLGSFFLVACENFSFEENFGLLSNQTIPTLEVTKGETEVFNLSSREGAKIDLQFETTGGEAEAVDIRVASEDDSTNFFSVKQIRSFPSTTEVTIEEIRAVLEESAVAEGATLYFTFDLIINDGERVKVGNASLSASITCPSAISTAEDNWSATGTNENGAGFPANTSADNVVITPLEGDNYLISDISAGFFDAIGFSNIQQGIYNDACNTITWVEPGQSTQFTFEDPEIPGSWDPINQTLTIYWYNPSNDFRGESVFVKQE